MIFLYFKYLNTKMRRLCNQLCLPSSQYVGWIVLVEDRPTNVVLQIPAGLRRGGVDPEKRDQTITTDHTFRKKRKNGKRGNWWHIAMIILEWLLLTSWQSCRGTGSCHRRGGWAEGRFQPAHCQTCPDEATGCICPAWKGKSEDSALWWGQLSWWRRKVTVFL